MRKSIFIALALAASTQVGCRMCQNCLDYSSPVVGYSCPSCTPDCHGVCRSGSTLGATPMVADAAPSEAALLRR